MGIVVRGIDVRRVHVQVVSEGRGVGRTRPVIALVADAIHAAVVQDDISATDKSQW